MEFWLDTANLEDIKKWRDLGLVQGATTNPTLLAREKRDALEQLEEVCRLVEGPVSAQVTARDWQGMVRHGRELAKVAPNIVVKVPATLDGYRAAIELKHSDIPINVTLIFHICQIIPFERIPVDYVSLILGRQEDFGLDPTNAKLRKPAGVKTVLASVRNPRHLLNAFSSLFDVITVPPSTWEILFQNPMTLQGENDFLSAWATLGDLRLDYEKGIL